MSSNEEILRANYEQAKRDIAKPSPVLFGMTLQTLKNEQRLGASVLERMEKAASDPTVYRTGNFFTRERSPVHLIYEIYSEIAKQPI